MPALGVPPKVSCFFPSKIVFTADMFPTVEFDYRYLRICINQQDRRGQNFASRVRDGYSTVPHNATLALFEGKTDTDV